MPRIIKLLIGLGLLFSTVTLAHGQDAQPVEPALVLADFETGLPLRIMPDGAAIGYIPWGDAVGNLVLSTRQILSESPLALTLQNPYANNVLAVDYQITGWGGFTHALTDGADWISMDWREYNAFTFWLYGTQTGAKIQVDLFDNRNPALPADTAERFFYRIDDDFSGWRQFTIPFELFRRRTDWQPAGAPNDGLGLDQASGYAFGFPANVGAQTILLDQIGLATITGSTLQIAQPQSAVDAGDWNLIWSDEFEGSAGTPVDATRWVHDIGGHGWGNNELQYYTDSPANAALDGSGNLAIVASQENPDQHVCSYGICWYTSARILTRDLFEFQYGRVEARMKIPTGQGIWPAFWMLGANFPEVGWPSSGEIDIMENVGNLPQNLYGTVHGPGYSGRDNIGGSIQLDQPLADAFQLYAIEWEADEIRWYFNDTLYFTVTPDSLNGNDWRFDHPFYMILNIAVGGNWPGYPNNKTVFPQTLLVDYVRVYQRPD